jgi:hypothetical protein
MSYLPDVAYDVVGQDLRCRMCTTSYDMTYDIDIRHRTCPTYDVVTYDVTVHTISSKRTQLENRLHQSGWMSTDHNTICFVFLR